MNYSHAKKMQVSIALIEEIWKDQPYLSFFQLIRYIESIAGFMQDESGHADPRAEEDILLDIWRLERKDKSKQQKKLCCCGEN